MSDINFNPINSKSTKSLRSVQNSKSHGDKKWDLLEGVKKGLEEFSLECNSNSNSTEIQKYC